MPYANHICEDLFMPIGFRVLWSYDHHSCNVWVFHSDRCSMDEQTHYFGIDAGDIHPDRVSEVEDMAYLSGYIKYDACSTISQNHTHLCGQQDYLMHMFLMGYLWTRALELMQSCPHEHEMDYEEPLQLVERMTAKNERFNRPPVSVPMPTGGA